MKRILLLVISTFIMFDISAQKESGSITKNIFQKIVFDVEAVPFSTSFNDHQPFSSYNFAIGYQIFKRADLRFNLDLIKMYLAQSYNVSGREEYLKLEAWSLGSKVLVYKWKDVSFPENPSIAVLGRFGFTFTPFDATQQSLFYDLSARVYLGSVPYIGFGMNYQFEYSPDPLSLDTDLRSYYISFGLDF